MWRWFAALAFLMVAGPLAATDSRLARLDTLETGRGWDAVGRLDIGGTGFCTAALIAPDRVLTAAHCLFDRRTGERIDPAQLEFLAGWRNGRAAAYRQVRRAVVHPDYAFDATDTAARVRNDLALLELQQPIRNTVITPFGIARPPRKGAQVGVVSYAVDRADAPSLQQLCDVKARQQGILVMSCSVDFGSSGAPVFLHGVDGPSIVSVVSAKAETDGGNVALGTALAGLLPALNAQLRAGEGHALPPPPSVNRVTAGARRETGAQFLRP